MIVAALSVGVLALLVAGALRSGGTSLVRTARADAIHDAAEGAPGAASVARLLDDRDVLVPGINIVHAVSLLIAAIPSAWALTELVDGLATGGALLGLGLVLVLMGDLLPRTVGRRRSGVLAYRLVPILRVAVRMGAWATDFIEEDDEDEEEDTQDEQDEEEVELISSVLEFSETVVREVMVPRPDMITIDSSAPITRVLEVVDENGFSRIPAVGEDVDDVVGLVIVKDLLPLLATNSAPETVAGIMRPIDFVPETKRVPDLLREMQASKSHLAVVVDEYGGTSGLVTIEDLLEELVGEIVDEYDEDELLVERLDDGTLKVDGRMPIDDLAGMLSTELPEEDWDTVGGLVLGMAGRVPIEGEKYEVGDLVFAVTRVQGRRVAEVVVDRLQLGSTPEEGA